MPPKKETKKDPKCPNGKCTLPPPKKEPKKGGGCGCAGTPMN